MDKGSQFFQTQDTDGASQSGTQLDGTETPFAASFTTAGMFVGDADSACIVFSCPSTGTPVGLLELQGSIDRCRSTNGQKPDANVATWATIPVYDPYTATYSADQAVNGASTITIDVQKCTHRWYRLKYTRTSGSNTPTAHMQRKGES